MNPRVAITFLIVVGVIAVSYSPSGLSLVDGVRAFAHELHRDNKLGTDTTGAVPHR